jgi:Na+-transporting NADH:ubiquinone oxidoreductase subunit F
VILRRDFLKSALAVGFAAGSHSQLWASSNAPPDPDEPQVRRFPHHAEVVKIEDLNHNIKRIRLKPQQADEFVFTPGQHVLLKAPDDYLADWNKRYNTSHKEIYRPYSFASNPSRRSDFDLIIKHYVAPRGKDVPPGVMSTYVHKHLKVGDVVTLSNPVGKLYAQNDSDRPIVVVAGGVGAAPFVCLLEHWFENKINQNRKIYFFLGVRSRRDLMLHEEFTAWSRTKENFSYIPALSDPQKGDDWKGETGYINLVLDKHFKEPFDADVYLAGPPIMIRFTRKVLASKGIENKRIHRDPIRVR